jgi:hypothetical protein
VAEPVGEGVAVAGGGDRVAGDGVRVLPGEPRAERAEGGPLRRIDDSVNGTQPRRRLADPDRPRQVGRVPPQSGAHVDDDRLARLDRAVARDAIAAAGYGDAFAHGLGHGLGIRVHEAPSLGKTSENVLAVGQVVTVEPGVYVDGWGGVRIEDVGVVEADGFRVLTGAPKAPPS